VSKPKKKQARIPNWIVFIISGGWIVSAGAMLFVSPKPNWLIGVFLVLTGMGIMVIRPVKDKRDQQITLSISALAIVGGIIFVTLSIANGWN
jgi:membrane protein implicated in regulation of membrane protease activity